MRAPTHGLVLCGCGGGLAFAGKWDGLLGGIDLGWGLQVVIGTVPVHVPVVVVDEQVVSSAEEYPVGYICCAVLRFPRVDVVRFAVGGGPIAFGEPAPAVPDSESYALTGGEKALFASDVHALPVAVESDTDHTGVAQVPVDGRHGDRFVAGFPCARDRLVSAADPR